MIIFKNNQFVRLVFNFLLQHYKQNVAIPMVGLNIDWGMAPFNYYTVSLASPCCRRR